MASDSYKTHTIRKIWCFKRFYHRYSTYCQHLVFSFVWECYLVLFLAMITVWLYGWQCWSVQRNTTSQQLLVGVPRNLDTHGPQGKKPADFDPMILFLQHHQVAGTSTLCEMSSQLLNRLPWPLEQTFMVLRAWIHCGDPLIFSPFSATSMSKLKCIQ